MKYMFGHDLIEKKHQIPNFRDIILGAQDGLVNVLGIILAVATATSDVRVVLIAGLAATFAESISMAAVAYTSTKADVEYYKGQLAREKWEIDNLPDVERKEIRDIYYGKGFRGRILDQIVKKITSTKKLWLTTMMEEELHLFKQASSPLKSAVVVGIAAIIGSLIPLLPFVLVGVQWGIIFSLVCSVIVLFVTGAIKNQVTIGRPLRGGLEMAAIGMGAAIVGYLVGSLLGAAI